MQIIVPIETKYEPRLPDQMAARSTAEREKFIAADSIDGKDIKSKVKSG